MLERIRDILFLLCTVIWMTACDDSKPSSWKAWKACKTEVRAHLLTPGTAKFESDFKAKYFQKEETVFVFNSYVDSQNEHGALVRQRFTCTTTATGWTIIGSGEFRVDGYTSSVELRPW